MARKLLRICLCFYFVWSAFAASSVMAQTDQAEALAQEISETTMSPFCPGRTISSCPSPQARELRAEIHHWLEAGSTKQQVLDRLLTAYGEDVRGEPQSEGFGLVGWLLPPLFVLVSAIFMIMKLRRMRDVTEAEKIVSPNSVNNSDTKERVARELKARLT